MRKYYEPIERHGLLNMREAAAAAGVTYQTFYGRVRRKEYPRPTRLAGGRAYYTTAEVETIRKQVLKDAENKKQVFQNEQQWKLLSENLKDLRRRLVASKDKSAPCTPLVVQWGRDIGEDQLQFIAKMFPGGIFAGAK